MNWISSPCHPRRSLSPHSLTSTLSFPKRASRTSVWSLSNAWACHSSAYVSSHRPLGSGRFCHGWRPRRHHNLRMMELHPRRRNLRMTQTECSRFTLEDSQTKVTGDSVADVGHLGTKQSPYLLDVENSRANKATA